jgi:hypothetical protein
MNDTNKNNSTDNDADEGFDDFRQGFDNGNFYGLEYVLEDFFQRSVRQPAAPIQKPVDWFGLYS